MEIAEKANTLISMAVERMTDEKDIARFSEINEIFNNASAIIDGNAYCEAMLKGWMVSQANNAIFLLFRRQLLTPEIDEMYRSLPTTEEAVKDFEEFEKKAAKEAEALEAQRAAFMDKQHVTDIFKAVLNGMSKEKAEEEYEKIQKQLANAKSLA